jgi:hypothetical protein
MKRQGAAITRVSLDAAEEVTDPKRKRLYQQCGILLSNMKDAVKGLSCTTAPIDSIIVCSGPQSTRTNKDLVPYFATEMGNSHKRCRPVPQMA